jgi:MFS family permease
MPSCYKENFCDDAKKITWRINWESNESLHNLIEQLSMYCAPEWKVGLFGATFLAGIVVGCSTVTRLGDKHGRRPVYMLGIVMHLTFMFGIMLVRNIFMTYLLTFIFGISVTARYYVGYTYSIEMQPKSHFVLVSTV